MQIAIDAAALVKGDDVTVFAWGFGESASDVWKEGLQQIATEPSKSTLVMDLTELTSYLETLRATVCAESTPSGDPISVHGDPMFQHNGKGQHFWLKENVSVPLLLWEHDGHKMRLNGVTFANAETGHQWFKEISLISDGGRAFGVHVSSKSDKLSLLSDVNGTLMRAGIFDLEVTSKGTKNNPESVTTIRAGGMKFALMAARAHKFADPEDQQKYAHVNLKMPEGLATGATGLLAELAGTQPMSVATKVLLRSPSSK